MSDNVPTIARAADRIAAGELSPVSLVESCLERIDRFDRRINAFHHVMREEALEAAREAEAEIRAGRLLGPLHGIPIALKDMIYVAGQKTTANSRVLADFRADTDAEVVRRLKRAGAVILGQLNTYEFAFGGRPTFEALFPPARNPWGLDRSTGGSSSGSAAAVAAGFCLGTLGSDAGGSIRAPAALCGVAGLKPTLGRVSTSGVIALTFGLDTVGPMAWTARDCALMIDALAGHDAGDTLSADVPVDDYTSALDGGVAGLRIGMVRHFHTDDFASPREITAAFDAMAETLERLGAAVSEVRLSPLMDYHAAGRIILPAEAYAIHEDTLRERFADFGPLVRNRMMLGALVRASDYLQAQRRRRELTDEVDAALCDVDLLLTAAMLTPPPPIDDTQPFPYLDAPMINVPFNMTGHPSIAVCCGILPDGMPIGAQIAGRHFDEATVLRAAHAYETATGWRETRPEL